MTTQLEDAEHTHQPNDSQNGQRRGLVVLFLLVSKHRTQRDEVGYDGHDVDHVHDALEELELERTTAEPEYEFEREPHDAYGLDDEEGLVEVRYVVLDDGERLVRAVVEVGYLVAFEVWQCFNAEYDYARQDHGHGDHGHQAGPLRRLRVLEQQPYVALQLVRWQ